MNVESTINRLLKIDARRQALQVEYEKYKDYIAPADLVTIEKHQQTASEFVPWALDKLGYTGLGAFPMFWIVSGAIAGIVGFLSIYYHDDWVAGFNRIMNAIDKHQNNDTMIIQAGKNVFEKSPDEIINPYTAGATGLGIGTIFGIGLAIWLLSKRR